jgi:hypothetical protein
VAENRVTSVVAEVLANPGRQARVTSVAAEVLATSVSQARVTSVAAEVLATASSKARVRSIAVEALVSSRRRGACPPGPKTAPSSCSLEGDDIPSANPDHEHLANWTQTSVQDESSAASPHPGRGLTGSGPQGPTTSRTPS